MGEQISVTHQYGDRLIVASCGVQLLSYVYKPDPEAFESRKPYAHPIRSLSNAIVTGYRPNDHRWHKGLQMTASHLSGQNFWGGNSYLPGQGYQERHDLIGWMRHDGFESVDVRDDRIDLLENLTWISNEGQPWATERRAIAVHSVRPDDGFWALDWAIDLTNRRGEPLRFGSPTTAGREMAGYTGLQWRGPREFIGGDILAPDERGGAELMGQQAPWLAFTGEHDDVDRHSTLVFAHAPENVDARHTSHWFVRSTPIPTVAFSWAFFEEFDLPPGESFRYRYRIVVADGAWDRERVEQTLKSLDW